MLICNCATSSFIVLGGRGGESSGGRADERGVKEPPDGEISFLCMVQRVLELLFLNTLLNQPTQLTVGQTDILLVVSLEI